MLQEMELSITTSIDFPIQKLIFLTRLVEGAKNYEQSMIEIHNSMIANNIPVGIYEFDSWWYYRNYSGDGYTGVFTFFF